MGELAWFWAPNPKLRKYSEPGVFTPGLIGSLRKHQKANVHGRMLISCIAKNDHEGMDLILDREPTLLNRPIFYRMNIQSIDYRDVWRTPLEAAVCERASLDTIMKLIERGAEIHDSVFEMCSRYETKEDNSGADDGDMVRAMIKRYQLGLQICTPTRLAPQPGPKM